MQMGADDDPAIIVPFYRPIVARTLRQVAPAVAQVRPSQQQRNPSPISKISLNPIFSATGNL